ncbi:MAG: hypothetical protein ACK4NW_01745 [Roseinatronobacter sp.]
MSADPVPRLLALLSVEESALLRGDFSALQDIRKTKEELADRLDQSGAEKGALDQLAAALSRNASLLSAARSGVADAQLMIKVLLKQHSTVTYGKDGQRLVMQDVSRHLERKA